MTWVRRHLQRIGGGPVHASDDGMWRMLCGARASRSHVDVNDSVTCRRCLRKLAHEDEQDRLNWEDERRRCGEVD